MAIMNAAEDKVKYCKSFGITISPEEWPCQHLPGSILADRGEMEGSIADCLVKELGVVIENAPPYRGDLKGIIEKNFHLINLAMTDLLPGKVKKDFGERCSRDYRLDARLDIRQFTAIIIRCVVVGVRSGNSMGALICFGVAAFMTFQAFENIGMCIGITPVIGIALPFFSYGGSSMVTLLGAMGIISGVKFKPKPERFIIQY